MRASDRRAVPGVVHAASATGQTVFVEPLEAIDLNNRLVQLSEDELAEIARILAELTERVRADRGPLEAAAAGHRAFRFDFCARAICARIRLRDAGILRPGIRCVSKTRAIPCSKPRCARRDAKPCRCRSRSGGVRNDVMVISGPNTGGKTVALKNVGLAALSAQSGIPVAAERAELPIFDHVLADIGDEQSIAADLSTFSAHMLNLKSMLEVATDRSLILVDEMGTGTAPEEGAALAVALLEEFRARRALTHRDHASRSPESLRLHHARNRERRDGI